ncbi:MAG: thiamine diphosphokinase [Eubacteriaceae bacterium]|nr:thiamine diphosphokinase [Eubacteriaceae bacterium]
MDKCIIITSFLNGKINDLIDISDSYIVCADGGYDRAAAENISPDAVIGDFDSVRSPLPDDTEIIQVPSHKDITDTSLCIDHAVEKGYRSIMILGGIGGRADHTVANIQNIVAAAEKDISVIMIDEQNMIMALIDDEIYLPSRPGYKLSLLAHSARCEGVTVTGVEYPLHDHTLTSDYPLGVSNEFIDNDAYIKVDKGQLLIIMSRD